MFTYFKDSEMSLLRKILRTVLLVVCILLPLLVSFLICRYSYNRHYTTFFTPYFVEWKYADGDANNDPEYLIDGYFQYQKKYFKKVATKEVKNDNTHLMDLAIYEVIEDLEGKENLVYYFFAYNVNYYDLAKWTYMGDEDDFEYYFDEPSYYMNTVSGEENYRFMFTDFDEASISDTGRLPEYDDRGIALSNVNILYTTRNGLDMPGDNIELNLMGFNSLGDELVLPVYSSDDKLSVDRVIIDIQYDNYEGFIQGYDGNPLMAGYKSFMFKHYWWWETLLCLVSIGLLTTSFYLVLTYEKE